tara:strand:- start:30 stop:2702 length:2673 start_codon:yes stop_codon:yes gene_type:complete
MIILRIFLVSLGLSHCVLAVSVGERSADNTVAAQLEAFQLHEDFEVNLFADESMGIANPVAMHWDQRGRLWILTTLTYAQLEPGEKPNDTLVILEDTDADGRADKSTVFADGLDMPMGFALGYGGVYVGEGADLLFFKDSDGDDRADSREVVLTGFGTGDTHQNISNFTWGPDGHLYFAQGLHCYSRVETPWGIVRGDSAGFFRFNPETLKLDPFCFPGLASQNPCGIAFDKTGAMFLKSNNRELIYVTPGLIPTTRKNNLVPIASVGATPGKSMGGEFVDSAHLPDWIQNHVLIAGYYSNRITAFPLEADGAGYATVEPVELLFSEHSSFRPVEIRIGPDGAIYVADWFNPIIGHYQASLRHPDRDAEHGRIWRVSAKGRALNDRSKWAHAESIPLLSFPNLAEAESLVQSDDVRDRLDGIVAAANSGEADGMKVALLALDRPTDRFINYALEQSVHGLSEYWVPAFEVGQIEFSKEEHLLYALSSLGGKLAVSIAVDRMDRGGLSQEMKKGYSGVLARNGSPGEMLALLQQVEGDSAVLEAMSEAWAKRRVRPAAGFEDEVLRLIDSNNTEIKRHAIRLAGLWKVVEAKSWVRNIVTTPKFEESLRGEAMMALARIELGRSVPILLKQWEASDQGLKRFVASALSEVAPAQLASILVDEMSRVESADQIIPLVSPLLNRNGGANQLMLAIQKNGLEAKKAGYLVEVMSLIGRSDEGLLAALQDSMGVMSGARAYSPDFVSKLAVEVIEKGDATEGGAVFQRPELTCVACHQIENVGGIIGPALDTVGSGLTADLLIESVLWPHRQLKEGYFGVAITTKSGEALFGYREKEEDGVYYLRDTASGEIKLIPRVEISKEQQVGSLMPAGLTNGLSREELRDLIAYLASLKG